MQTFILTLGAEPEILPTDVVAIEGSIFLERNVAVREGAAAAAEEKVLFLEAVPAVDDEMVALAPAGGTIGDPVADAFGFFGGDG